ncbi:MAG: acetyl-CoA C-acyltransferase [candidate division KSB1 bacterium]|nr:acetyl-CoA C-acyltransferase [candidate division KSB1 bacterium]
MANKTHANSVRRAVVVDGCRIPFLRSGTQYRDLSAYDLARLAIKAILHKTQIEPGRIDQVIMGNVIVNNKYSNVARQAALAAGVPHQVPAYTITLACVSANQAITDAVALIETGQADVVLAGGTESLTDVPIPLRKRLRDKLVEAQKYRGPMDYMKFFKGLRPKDLLPDVPAIAEFSTGRTMGQDCDRLAARIGVSRQEQDEYALRSHQLAARATREGLFNDEVVPVRVPPHFEPVQKDNGIREDSTLEKLASLKPAFVRPYGTLTAGNSSFLTDGAAVVLLMAEEAARALSYRPKAAVKGYAYSAQDPREELLLGPAYATPRVLDQTGLTLKDIQVFEFHEAFAAQILANLKCLASDQFAREHLGRDKAVGEIPMEQFNTLGGSLSLGHPFGATGARLITTAANRLQREDGQFALVAACAAGAIGSAIVLERLN